MKTTIQQEFPMALTGAEQYVLSRVRDAEPLSHMHRGVLWRLALRGIPICLRSN